MNGKNIAFTNSKTGDRSDLVVTVFERCHIFIGDPKGICFELFLAWIHTLMLAYPTQSESKELRHTLTSRSFSRKSIVSAN